MNGLVLRIVLPSAALALGALAVLALLDRMAADQRAAAVRALHARAAALDRAALAPGTALACLNGEAGDTAENACEKLVFATPQSTAAAVAYVGARLGLVRDAAALAQAGDDSAAESFAGVRRALSLDRYGVAAHVLATRDGCTADRCDAFALFDNTAALKANLKAQVFDQYVSRYASAWTASAPALAASAAPQAPSVTTPPDDTHPVSEKWDFPSAASIPPVSIMNPEPPLPKGTTAQAAPADKAADKPPVPPQRPEAGAQPLPR